MMIKSHGNLIFERFNSTVSSNVAFNCTTEHFTCFTVLEHFMNIWYERIRLI